MIIGYVFCFIVGAVLGIFASAIVSGPEYPSVPYEDFDVNLDDITLVEDSFQIEEECLEKD